MIPRRLLSLVLCTVTALGGCSSSADDEPGQPTAPVSPATTVPVRTACTAVTEEALAFATEISQLTTDDATVEQLRAAAADLSGAVDDAKATVGPDARASLEEAGQALERMQDALTTDPLDWTVLRTAANDLVTALTNVVGLCASGSSTSPPAPTS